jgi:tRNA A-37 threonylcarbamoyl transferase component Bud32
VVSCSRDGVRWKLRSEFQPLLVAVLTSPPTIVRESPVRTVTLHWVNGLPYYVKRYLIGRSPWCRLLFLFKRPPAEDQWETGVRLESMGVPVVRFLACGTRRSLVGLEESILITQGFDGVPPVEPSPDDCAAILRFVQAMHDRGVIQPDLHAGNLLISPQSGELRLVDVGHVRFRRTLSRAERERNVAFLKLSVPIALPAEVEACSRELRKAVYRRRSKRCLKQNREFAGENAGPVVWQLRLPLVTDSLRDVMQDPDGFLRSKARILKAGRSTTIGSHDGLVIKRFNLTKPVNLVKDLFRVSRAKRNFRLAYHLELLGIPTPRAVAFGERRKAGFLLRSYYAAEEISDAGNLSAIVQSDRRPDRAVIGNLARLIAHLHNEGFSHRDLKASNFMVGRDNTVFLLDLDGLKFKDRISDAQARANLARLARSIADSPVVGRAERTEFLLRYCRARAQGA